MTNAQYAILALLRAHPEGLYGSDLVKMSDSKLKMHAVYVQLGLLIDAGLVREVKDPPVAAHPLQRTRFHLTDAGRRQPAPAPSSGHPSTGSGGQLKPA